MLLNADLNSIAHINMLCNDYGLDTISTLACIAFAMEAYEKGMLTANDLDDMDLTWNAAAIVAWFTRSRTARASATGWPKGCGSPPSAWAGSSGVYPPRQGHGAPVPRPARFVSMAVNYATANGGGCHMEAITYYEGYGVEVPGLVFRPGTDQWQARLQSEDSGRMAVRYQNYQSVYNPLGLCKFIIKGLTGPDETAALVNHALGWNWSSDDVFRTGERIFNLKRLINLRYGITAADDVLPIASPSSRVPAAAQQVCCRTCRG